MVSFDRQVADTRLLYYEIMGNALLSLSSKDFTKLVLDLNAQLDPFFSELIQDIQSVYFKSYKTKPNHTALNKRKWIFIMCPTLTVSWWFFRNPSPSSSLRPRWVVSPGVVPRCVWRRWTRGGYPIVRVLLVVCKLTTLHLGRDDRGKENTVSPP